MSAIWMNRSSPPVMLGLEQARHIAEMIEEYESNDLDVVCAEFWHHPWGNPGVSFLWEEPDTGAEGWEAFWLLEPDETNGRCLQLVTDEDFDEGEALVADFERQRREPVGEIEAPNG